MQPSEHTSPRDCFESHRTEHDDVLTLPDRGPYLQSENNHPEYHEADVECPVCGRALTYRFGFRGFFNTDTGDRLRHPPERFTEAAPDGGTYFSGEWYGLPIDSPQLPPSTDVEMTYVLEEVHHDGDIIADDFPY